MINPAITKLIDSAMIVRVPHGSAMNLVPKIIPTIQVIAIRMQARIGKIFMPNPTLTEDPL